jgi:type VI secretion system protein ImpH
VTVWDDLNVAPERHDFLRTMRELERSTPTKPRIGENTVLGEEIVSLGQDPLTAFPESNITAVGKTTRGTPKLFTRFLGFFGPQGALPLATTVEAYTWVNGIQGVRQDSSFPRFVDIFANRFVQLFFRAWADARPIAHRDRPGDDRFARYIASFAGIGTAATANRDGVPDIAKLPYAGLVSPRVKSARRLAQLIRGVFKLDAAVIERIGSWLQFEPDDRMALGARGSGLGVDSFVGTRAYSINDKFRIAIKTTSLEQYSGLLPNAPMSDNLADLVFFHIGYRFEYDVELSLPARLAPPARLGESGQLGWTAWIAPRADAGEDEYLSDARFDLAERRKAAQAAQSRLKSGKGAKAER